VEFIGALKDQYGNWYLVLKRHGKPKRRTQVDGKSKRILPLPTNRWPNMPFLRSAKYVFLRELTKQPATTSEDKAGEMI
jgi:hypothetical protein